MADVVAGPPTASAAAKATTPTTNTAMVIGGRSAGLKIRSVPMRASKYSLNASTPTTERPIPASPTQNTNASKRPAMAKAHAAPSRYGSTPANRKNR